MESRTYLSLASLITFSCTMSLGWLSFGMIYVTLNGTAKQIEYSYAWPLNEIDEIVSWSSSLIFLGIATANAFGSYYLQMVSRRRSLLLADILIVIGSGSMLINNIPYFLTGRFILGLGMGLNYLVVPIFIREISPPEISGKLGSFNKICYSTGNCIAFAMCLGLPKIPEVNNYWKLIFILPAGFAILRFILILTVFKLDSPKYYFLIKDRELAMKAIKQIYRPDLVDKIIELFANQATSTKSTSTKEIFTDYRRQFLTCIISFSIYQFSGLNTINFYSTEILMGGATDSADIELARMVNLAIGLLRFIANLCGSTLLDWSGRRKSYLYGGLVISSSMAVLSFSLYEEISILSKVSVLIFSFGMAISYTLINPIYVAECLPFKGCGLVGVVENLLAFGVVLTYKPLSHALGIHIVFAIYAGLIFIGITQAKIYVIETKGLTMEEIFDRYKNFGMPMNELKKTFLESSIVEDSKNSGSTLKTRLIQSNQKRSVVSIEYSQSMS